MLSCRLRLIVSSEVGVLREIAAMIREILGQTRLRSFLTSLESVPEFRSSVGGRLFQQLQCPLPQVLTSRLIGRRLRGLPFSLSIEWR